MSKMAEFVTDFLEIVADHPKYKDKNWDWDNLPTFETMWEIMHNPRREKK